MGKSYPLQQVADKLFHFIFYSMAGDTVTNQHLNAEFLRMLTNLSQGVGNPHVKIQIIHIYCISEINNNNEPSLSKFDQFSMKLKTCSHQKHLNYSTSISHHQSFDIKANPSRINAQHTVHCFIALMRKYAFQERYKT